MPTLSNFSLGNYTLGGLTDGMMKYATGEVTSTTATLLFNDVNSSFNAYVASVNGLSFRPTRIILRNKSAPSNRGMIVYNKDTFGAQPSSAGTNYNLATYLTSNAGTGYIFKVYEITGGSFNQVGQVTDSGFRLPVPSAGEVYVWEIWG
ncbi:hypothetical protein HUB98_08980 [Paenibacillus barcinonensis]|uniref:Uncharacterized protein n=1 Tax=Paenibacillus barcinonensis TaxID=198119 RepID=A0A2V4VTC2_PAEBA|nr:hypothetical protein [Paenibacillus barcinonensis]PYE49869.1 hypothetical protein DFQ00_105373 [Paenibacillus barcinonensis]QKS56460.1 hypothetical protein HUB98_08980 [Paenibacillus barcinonensis]